MMKIERILVAAVAASLLVAPLAEGQEPDVRPVSGECARGSSPLLILGTYHMSNPGLDSYNVEADDVRSPRRQREIAELVDRLIRFRPTIVAVEAKYGSSIWPDRYEQWLTGDYELGRDEIEQIGFRLVRRSALENVSPVDYPMWMNGWRNDEIDWDRLEAQGTVEESPEEQGEGEDPAPAAMTPDQRRLLETTTSEYLAWLNSSERIDRGHVTYLRMLLPHDGIGIYSRTDQVRNWYERNLRIFTNLNRLTRHGEDRVILIIGSGHLKLLRQFAADASYFCLVDTPSYLTDSM